ncbi:hypothetical protein [Streptomyces griseosporeus]|uniref:hypothetical protein n=1 Tax=Streptomyces griseosporeus TaxID=1910 RepID=UPI00167EB561|nr:hypothetical protein [Streptomyces griseosporeus]GHF55595.1 hypothetical protein GCM10018783_25960 [Streptomyces griseosporeus]
MTDAEEEYAFLWNGTEEGWVTVQTEVGETIWNISTRRALLIDDDDLASQVIHLMHEHGCPSLDAMQ